MISSMEFYLVLTSKISFNVGRLIACSLSSSAAVMNPSPPGLRLSVERVERLSIEVDRASWMATMVVSVLLVLGWLLAFR
jgi:hypothetical protein